MDGLPLAQALRHQIASLGWLPKFYDADDLPPGCDWQAELEKNVGASLIVMLRTEEYENRHWCQQEVLWDAVAHEISDNVRDMEPLLRDRFRTKTSGNAPDVLHSYEALGEGQLGSLRKFIDAFDQLYTNLSEDQKKIADVIKDVVGEHVQ